MEYRAHNLQPPSQERMQELASIAEIEGVEVLVK
jgi:hypothetical protein